MGPGNRGAGGQCVSPPRVHWPPLGVAEMWREERRGGNKERRIGEGTRILGIWDSAETWSVTWGWEEEICHSRQKSNKDFKVKNNFPFQYYCCQICCFRNFGCDAFLRPDINLLAFSDPGRLRGCLQQRRLEQARGGWIPLCKKKHGVIQQRNPHYLWVYWVQPVFWRR